MESAHCIVRIFIQGSQVQRSAGRLATLWGLQTREMIQKSELADGGHTHTQTAYNLSVVAHRKLTKQSHNPLDLSITVSLEGK